MLHKFYSFSLMIANNNWNFDTTLKLKWSVRPNSEHQTQRNCVDELWIFCFSFYTLTPHADAYLVEVHCFLINELIALMRVFSSVARKIKSFHKSLVKTMIHSCTFFCVGGMQSWVFRRLCDAAERKSVYYRNALKCMYFPLKFQHILFTCSQEHFKANFLR